MMELQEFIHSVERLRGDMLRQAGHYLDNPDDTEDAVQETLVKLWMVRDRLPDASKMRNMAGVVCRNVSLNMIRDRKQAVPIDSASNIVTLNNPHEQLEEQESRQRLRQGFNKLTDKQRAIIRMRNVENLSYADIAKVIGTTESSVRGMISKARATLLKEMKGATS